MKGNAMIWDFDGTLVDSRQKNYSVNRKLIASVTGRPAESFPLLHSQEQFEAADARSKNWREFYLNDFGMSAIETDEAGRLFTEFQLQDKTQTPVFAGIADTLATLDDLPQGIVSQNSRAMIQATLIETALARHFDTIIGYEEIAYDEQKPAPAGFLRCLQQLTQLRPGIVFYIGDFETDALQAFNAQKAIRQNGLDIEIVAIGAFYGASTSDELWTTKPDYRVQHPKEIIKIVRDKLGG